MLRLAKHLRSMLLVLLMAFGEFFGNLYIRSGILGKILIFPVLILCITPLILFASRHLNEKSEDLL